MTATLNINEALKGIEISFSSKPITATLDALKKIGFRWHGQKKLWYAKNTPERLELAQIIANTSEYAEKVRQEEPKKAAAKKAEPVNKYGVKVGDMFYTSWGYEQTNVNFFQVIGLKGTSSVIVREVHPKMTEETPTCSMAADRRYEATKEILPAASYASFINDNENGDLRRVNYNDYNKQPYINVGRKGGYKDTAYPYTGQTVYESWYY